MLAQCHALVERPEHPNAIKVGKRWNTPGHQTSRDDELVVAEHRTVGQRYRLFSRVQADGSRPQPKCDVLFVVELAGFEGHIVDPLRSTSLDSGGRSYGRCTSSLTIVRRPE